METNNIAFADMPDWAADKLFREGFTLYSQIVTQKESYLRSKLGLGTLLALSKHLEKRGLSYIGWEDSLTRLHLHAPGVRMLERHELFDLVDLQLCSEMDLAYKIGFGRERAKYISSRMSYLGRPIR